MPLLTVSECSDEKERLAVFNHISLVYFVVISMLAVAFGGYLVLNFINTRNYYTLLFMLGVALVIIGITAAGVFGNRSQEKSPKNRQYYMIPSTIAAGIVLIFSWVLMYGPEKNRPTFTLLMLVFATCAMTLGIYMYMSVGE